MTAPQMPTFAELDFALDDAAQVVELRAEIERMKAAADIEARVLKEIAFRIRDVFPESSRIIELSATNLAALVA